jgi:MFS family permease
LLLLCSCARGQLCGDEDAVANDGDGDDGVCAKASFVAAVYALGALAGAVVAGPLMDRFGRRRLYLFNTCVFILGWLCVGLCSCYGVLVRRTPLEGAIGKDDAVSFYDACSTAVASCSTLDNKMNGVMAE